MSISPAEAESSVDTNKVKDVVRIIDFKLSNPSFISRYRCGPPGNYWYDILYTGELNSREKAIVKGTYVASGWKDVDIVNSSENDERPGLCRIRLYK